MKTLCYLNDQLELLKEIQTRRLSTAVKEDIERVQECIEEVKELSKPCDCQAGSFDWYVKSNTKTKSDVDKIMNSSARKIVAMLFWEWKKTKRVIIDFNEKYTPNEAQADHCFKLAYKLLKDSK